MDFIEVTINNWEKYNKRKDYKRPYWFALSNRLIEDADFISFSGDEFKAWIYVLSQASQRCCGTVKIHFEHAGRVCGISKKTLINTATKLISLEICTGSVQDPNATLHNTTEQNSTIQNSTESVQDPNRSKIWETYRLNYRRRYGVEPVRNAKTNSHIKALVTRLGEEDAKKVVEFFMDHNEGFYLKRTHDIGLCLKDAESLRTQMLRNKPVTTTDIRAFEKQDYYSAQITRLTEAPK